MIYLQHMAIKKVTLATIADQIAKLDARMERSFEAVAEDISKLATQEQIIGSHPVSTPGGLVAVRRPEPLRGRRASARVVAR